MKKPKKQSTKKLKIGQEKKRKYDRDINLWCVLQCRSCGKAHEFASYKMFYYCSCGKQLVFFETINHLHSWVIYKKANWLTDNFRTYNKWS